MGTSKLKIAKDIIKKYYEKANCGIFNTRNICGDCMTTIYTEKGLTIDICYRYAYFEVFGLKDNEFEELEKFYKTLRESKLC